MPGKLLSARCLTFVAGMAGVLLPLAEVSAQEVSPANAKFLGAAGCASAMCHGGAGELRGQHAIWSKLDFHTRAHATLTSTRSQRFADTLKLGNPADSARCTVCHHPFQTVPAEKKSAGVGQFEGVSCESCHGAAESWVRFHTRADISHADRVNAGMRDLKNLHVRANTCVACHQNLDPDLRAAGHPELIFELDGQSVAEPKHWRETNAWSGPQAWLVGQAVALREMSWQLEREPGAKKTESDRQQALRWLLEKTSGGNAPDATVPAWSDQLARTVAAKNGSAAATRAQLAALAASHGDFKNAAIPQPLQARRAERLVLGLDRLLAPLKLEKKSPPNVKLDQLFKDAQSLPDFDPARFAAHLAEFELALKEFKPAQP